MASLSSPSAGSYCLPPRATLCCHRNHLSLPIQVKQFEVTHKKNNYINYAAVIQRLCRTNQPRVAKNLIMKLKARGITTLDNSTLSSLMLCYASNGLLSEAEGIFDEILNSCYTLDVEVISRLVEICGKLRNVDMIDYVIRQVKFKDSKLLARVLSLVVVSFGRRGEIELMELILGKMGSMGYKVDSVSGNAIMICYSVYGSLTEMEAAYGWLKRSRILIEEAAIRAIGLAYIREEKFYRLGKFVEDVGLGRRNVGNLLWNLLILSYAAKFKMKSMQREFVRMVESGFRPDLTTFNIRAMAFSKMFLFWDLHLSLEHIKQEGIAPDLVTYSCIIDAYVERRLGNNLCFMLNNMNGDDSVMVLTDPIVFEAMGKGDFHASSEPLLEFARKNGWTYKELIAIYLRKSFRRNQIFWNY